MNIITRSPTEHLCQFLAAVQYKDLPDYLVRRTEDLFLDWFASALAGKSGKPVSLIERFAVAMACKPATPAPKMNTLAGLIMPAAVIIIGNIRP